MQNMKDFSGMRPLLNVILVKNKLPNTYKRIHVVFEIEINVTKFTSFSNIICHELFFILRFLLYILK